MPVLRQQCRCIGVIVLKILVIEDDEAIADVSRWFWRKLATGW